LFFLIFMCAYFALAQRRGAAATGAGATARSALAAPRRASTADDILACSAAAREANEGM
jgi:hypothetical protein